MTLSLRSVFAVKKDVDMTVGNIVSLLAKFSLPLLLGNIFQQLYNTVDAWVVGNFVSNEAFSAVGTVGPIINVLIGFFLGLSAGAGVVISQFYGAGEKEKVNRVVHSCMTVTFIMCIIFTAIGLLATPFTLQMMKTPDDVFPESRAYLTIYFAGVSGLLIYNMGSAIMRAVGDSGRPFIFLCISAVMNIALDLLFVIKFSLGVRGVAYATIISQGVSAVLVIGSLIRSDNCVRFSFLKMNLDRKMLGLVFKVGIPSAVQMAVTAFSNIFVQSYINQFGSDMMGGWTAYQKLDAFLFMPMQSVAIGVTTFVGQNLGKQQVDRAKKGVRIGFAMSIVITFVILVPIFVFAPHFTAFFNSKPEVIENGALLLHWLSPFYLINCVNQIYAAALRGSGNTRTPTFIMLFSYVLFRQIYLFVVSNFISNTIIPLAMGYPIGWILCSLIMYIYYRKADLSEFRLKVS